MGIFIAIDGPNGVGKTTLIRLIERKLSETHSVIITKEPSDTPFGNKIRENEESVRGVEYARLIANDRQNHICNEILPVLKTKKIIISDRYIASSLALQFLDGVSLEDIWTLNKDFLKPDLYVVLSAEPHILEKRIDKRNMLTFFEATKSRRDEMKAFYQAYDYLILNGWALTLLNNNDNEQLEYNADFIIAWILKHEEKLL